MKAEGQKRREGESIGGQMGKWVRAEGQVGGEGEGSGAGGGEGQGSG